MAATDRDVDEGAAFARARTLRNLVGALVGGLLIATVEFAATRASVEYSVAEQLGWLARLAVHWALAALPIGVAIEVAERRAPGGAHIRGLAAPAPPSPRGKSPRRPPAGRSRTSSGWPTLRRCGSIRFMSARIPGAITPRSCSPR